MVRVELKGYQEALGVWDEKPVRRAAASALKKVVASAASTASTEIRRVYNVKKLDLDPRIEIRPPRATDLVAEIRISGKGMSLSFFGARQTSGTRVITRSGAGKKAALKTKTMKRSAKFQGVQVEIEKGEKTELKSAFLARMSNGHIGVVQRSTGKYAKNRVGLGKRKPYGENKFTQAIFEKQVISIATMAQNAKVEPAVLQKVQEAWDRIFPQELNYFTKVKGSQS